MKTLLRSSALLLAGLALYGCEDTPEVPTETPNEWGEEYFGDSNYIRPDTHVNVIRQILFESEESPGVSRGFNLDGEVSPDNDPMSCGHGDSTSPTGVEGVDNQFARLWTQLEPLVGEQVEGLLQGAINEGLVLMMVELEEVEDLQNDDQVRVNVYRGLADPDISALGLLTPDQTFFYDYQSPLSTIDTATIVDGELVAGPLVMSVPLNILDLNVILDLQGAYIRAQIDDDGSMEGYFSGAFSVSFMIEELLTTGAAAEAQLVQPLFESNADMGYVDGVCDLLSVSFGFESTNAFTVRNSEADQTYTGNETGDRNTQ